MKRDTLIWLILLVAAALWIVYRAATLGVGSQYVTRVPDGQFVSASAWDAVAGTAQFSLARTIGTWVAALFTLAIFSFLYRDNPFYKIAESVVVGVSAAYWMVVAFWTTIIPNLLGKLFPAWVNSWALPDLPPVRQAYWWTYFIPLALGILLLWRLSPRGSWIARWPLAFIIGTTAGIRLIGFIQADFLSQINSSIQPLVVTEQADQATPAALGSTHFQVGDQIVLVGSSINSILLLTGVLCCLVYFFFSFEHKGIVGRISRVGIWFLMITFGAAFGYTVMGRIALLAIRLEFLFDDWLWLIDPTQVRPPGW